MNHLSFTWWQKVLTLHQSIIVLFFYRAASLQYKLLENYLKRHFLSLRLKIEIKCTSFSLFMCILCLVLWCKIVNSLKSFSNILLFSLFLSMSLGRVKNIKPLCFLCIIRSPLQGCSLALSPQENNFKGSFFWAFSGPPTKLAQNFMAVMEWKQELWISLLLHTCRPLVNL